MFTNISWKDLHHIIKQTIQDMLDEQQMLDVLSLRTRLQEMAENESDEVMVLCYWQACKVLMRLPPTVTATELMTAARTAFRTPINHDVLNEQDRLNT